MGHEKTAGGEPKEEKDTLNQTKIKLLFSCFHVINPATFWR
jgi:hypothetical protein